MPKVYVVTNSTDYEGYGAPMGVYTTADAARSAIAAIRSKYEDTMFEIFEADMDAPLRYFGVAIE